VFEEKYAGFGCGRLDLVPAPVNACENLTIFARYLDIVFLVADLSLEFHVRRVRGSLIVDRGSWFVVRRSNPGE
jgi:hypothetical protein